MVLDRTQADTIKLGAINILVVTVQKEDKYRDLNGRNEITFAGRPFSGLDPVSRSRPLVIGCISDATGK